MFGKNFFNSKNESDRKPSPKPFQEEDDEDSNYQTFNNQPSKFLKSDFANKFQPMNTNQRFFESNFDKEPTNTEGKKFIEKYRDNIHKIFDECSERGEIEIPKLKSLLAEAGFLKKYIILRKLFVFRCK